MINYFNLVKKATQLIPDKLYKKFKLIFLLLSLAGVLETLGLGLIIPLISEILDSEMTKYSFVKYFGLSGNDKTYILKILSVSIFFVYFLKSIYLTKLEFYIQNFSQLIKAEMTLKLFRKYIFRKYETNLNFNSSILLRNLTSEIHNFTAGVLDPLIMLAKETFIILLIMIMLFTINLKVSLFILVFSGIFFLIAKNLFGNILEKLGHSEQKIKGQQNKVIMESLQGIKFIKSYKLENLFSKELQNVFYNFVSIKSKSTALRILPRIWIEFFIIFFLFLLSFIFISMGYKMTEFIFFVSIFMIAMIKIMPALISIIRVVNVFSNYKASIHLIDEELKEKINETENIYQTSENLKELQFEKNFECKDINFTYGKSSEIIKNLSLEINRENDIVGIYGPSGSGKTTIVDILIGLLTPNNGKFYVDGIETDISKYKQIFGYVPQTTFLFDDTIKNNIIISNYQKQNTSDKQFMDVLKITQLYEFVQSLENKENTLIGENGVKLSGGQRQRIGIARALIYDPKILIIDEATSGLDKETEKKVLNDLKVISRKKSIIAISHSSNIWEYCNKLYNLSDKKLVRIK